MAAAMRRLRIAQVAPPVERVPPAAYGGTERVVDELTRQLVDRGHDVTVFASGDSDVAGRLVPTVERALRPAGIESDASGWFATTVKMVIEQAAGFDVIHSHLEWWSIPLARLSPVPTVATFHGRLDLPWADRLLGDAPDGMVAISRHQASTHPNVPWTIIHNGLTLDRAPFIEEPGDAFCFVGRIDAEKGIIEAIEIAQRAGRRLRIAAKVGNLARQRDYYESVFRPALQRAGHSVEYLGELQPAERDQLFAESYATLMPGAWPEPFGLVSIESLACGTPVLARRVGALPEIIREGVDGFFGDDAVAMAFFADRLGALDRREIRERVIERFSAARMADRYEEQYARMIAVASRLTGVRERAPDAAEVEEALAVQLPVQVTEPADAELPDKRNGARPPQVTKEAEEEAEKVAVAVGVTAEPAEAADQAANAVGASAGAMEVAEPAEAIAEPAEPVAEPAEAVAEPAEAVEETAESIEPAEAVAEPAEAVAEPAEAIAQPAEPVAEPAEPVAEPAEAIAEPAEAVAEPAEAVVEPPEAVEPPEGVEETAESIEPSVAFVEPAEAVAEATEPVAETSEAIPEPSEAIAEPAEAVAEPTEAIAEPAEAVAQPTEATAEPAEIEQAAALTVEAAVVEVVVADSTAAIEPETIGSLEPVAEEVAEAVKPEAAEPVAEEVVEAAEPEPVPGPPELVAAPVGAGAEAESETVAEAEPAPEVEAAPSPADTPADVTTRPPVAVGPGPSSAEPKPTAPPAPASQPAPAPVAKRPSRPISIFTRSWSAGSGKKAAGARRHDRS